MSKMKVIHNSRGIFGSIILGALSFGIFVTVLFLNGKLRKEQQYEKNTHFFAPAVSSSSERGEETPVYNPPTKINSEQQFRGAVVRYTTHGFSPHAITLQKYDESNCMLHIINDTHDVLIIRLSPHTSRDNWGFTYTPVAPGASLSIDPRYRIPKIAFHNHERPEDEFKVILGDECVMQ